VYTNLVKQFSPYPKGLHPTQPARPLIQQRNGDILWFSRGAEKALASFETFTQKPASQLKQQVFLLNHELHQQAPQYFDYNEGIEYPSTAMPNHWREDWLAAVHITRSAVKRYLNLNNVLGTSHKKQLNIKQYAMLDDASAPVNDPHYLDDTLFRLNDAIFQTPITKASEPLAFIEHSYKPQLPEGKTSHLISSPLMLPEEGAYTPVEKYAPTKRLNTVVCSTLRQWGFEEGQGQDFMLKPHNPFFSG
jgi:hypothetical protein